MSAIITEPESQDESQDENQDENQKALRRKAFGAITIAYLAAFAAGGLGLMLFDDAPPILRILAADLIATVTLFGFARYHQNSSVFDASWSVLPIAIVAYFLAIYGVTTLGVLIAVAVLIWGVRLTYNWARSFPGLHHEDFRYRDLKARSGKLAPFIDLFGIHLFPSSIVFLSLVPAWLAVSSGISGASPLAIAGFLLALAGTALEGIADRQLYEFNQIKEPGELLDRGLFAHLRHPNYLGELGFWWGLALIGASVAPASPWSYAGAVGMTLMFAFYSIPALDSRSLTRRPGYAEYMKRTPALLPRFKR